MPLPFTSSRRRSVGLDLDGAFVAAVELEGGAIARAASRDLPPGLIVDGEVGDPVELRGVLKAFFSAHALPRSVRLGVSNQQILVRQLELPRIDDPRERAAAVRFQSAEAIAMPLDEAVLDFQPVGETVTPEGAVRTRFVVVAARAAMIESWVEVVRGAGLRPLGIDLNAFALVRALAPAADGDDAARVHCHLGGVTNLAVAAGSCCLFTRPLARQALESGEAPAPGAAAAAAYYSPASAPVAEARPGVPAAVAALAEEIRLSIDSYMAQPEARWVREVVLSGPGAVRPGLAEELREALGLAVSVAEPLGALGRGGLPPHEDPHRHTVAAGLALGAAA
jgi:type IV pilus assembly protein PilM